MMLISTQQDQARFCWEIMIQDKNFAELGIDRSKCFALVGFVNKPSKDVLKLINNVKINVITIEDTREDRTYAPSIRPHLIWKFFERFPHFRNDPFLYHDSDIIFRQIPDWTTMSDGRWHVADAGPNNGGYMNAGYILSKGDEVFRDMANAVGSTPTKLVEYEHIYGGVGGAQHLVPGGTPVELWKKIQLDCERMFREINADKKAYYRQKYSYEAGKNDIQIWCAEMWAITWNAWLAGYVTHVNPELRFSWGSNSQQDYLKWNIFHNSEMLPGGFNKELYKYGYPTAEHPVYLDHAQHNYVVYLNSLIDKFKELANDI